MLKTQIVCAALLSITINAFAQTSPVPTPHWRPTYHFSPPQNWTNDPNGLIYLNGEYHLYYQHNPLENKWGHMSWGHAKSKDLISWTNLPVAIPEMVTKDTTIFIYSGSAVLDKNNTSGFGKDGKAPLVALYTADLPKQHNESQAIAYSNDGGLTFTQYPGNPVIDLNKKDFRDPNVFWHEASKQWIMSVAMVDEHMVRFYASENLKKWAKLSDFGPAGFTKNGWECPSLVQLPVNGDSSQMKWVLFVSLFGDNGPVMQYFTGDFDGTHFTNDNSESLILKVDYGDSFYAAIPWRDAPKEKKVLLGWLINGSRETYPWKGQMSIPRDLSLKTTSEGLRLVQQPSEVVSRSLDKYAKGNKLTQRNLKINGTSNIINNAVFPANSNWIDAEFNVEEAKKFGFKLVQSNQSATGITVGYNVEKQEIFIDCAATEKSNKKEVNLYQSAQLKPIDGTVRLQVLLDKSSLEVFGNNGEKVISTMVYPDKDATGITIFSEGSTTIKQLKVWNLNR
jgi:fructan beta-fructosidase